MKNKLFSLSVTGFIFTGILGTLCHFIYELSGYNSAAALFCPVNESVWEHLKLIFFPYLIWLVAQQLIIKNKKIIFSKAVGVFIGMTCILTFYYTYTGITGENIDLLNILSFFIGVFAAFFTDYLMIKSNKFQSAAYSVVGIAVFAIFICLFFLFTFFPPLLPLFRDPINFTYGV